MKPPPDVEFTAALACAYDALRAVLGDRAVWAVEADRTDAEPLPWPLVREKTGYPQLLRAFAEQAVDNALDGLRLRHGYELTLDAADPGFQIILRVVRRAVDAADIELRKQFGGARGGTHRLSGGLKFKNWLKARDVDAAIQSGKPIGEALSKLPISRAAAYRAMKRKA